MIELTQGNPKLFQKRGLCLHIMFGPLMPPTSTCDIAAPVVLPVSFAQENELPPGLKKFNSKQFRRHGGSGKDHATSASDGFLCVLEACWVNLELH